MDNESVEDFRSCGTSVRGGGGERTGRFGILRCRRIGGGRRFGDGECVCHSGGGGLVWMEGHRETFMDSEGGWKRSCGR